MTENETLFFKKFSEAMNLLKAQSDASSELVLKQSQVLTRQSAQIELLSEQVSTLSRQVLALNERVMHSGQEPPR